MNTSLGFTSAAYKQEAFEFAILTLLDVFTRTDKVVSSDAYAFL